MPCVASCLSSGHRSIILDCNFIYSFNFNLKVRDKDITHPFALKYICFVCVCVCVSEVERAPVFLERGCRRYLRQNTHRDLLQFQ